jgi:hypothetical protein
MPPFSGPKRFSYTSGKKLLKNFPKHVQIYKASYPKYIEFPTVSNINNVSAQTSLVELTVLSSKKRAKGSPFTYVRSKNCELYLVCCVVIIATVVTRTRHYVA